MADPSETGQTRATVDVDMGHEYDGIRELDNRLPNWWLFTLWAAVVFGFGYWAWFHSLGAGPTQLEKLALENAMAEEAMAEREAEQRAELAAKTPGGAPVTLADTLAALRKDEAALARGKETFVQSCAPCHRKDGGGTIGPNLTDDYVIHGAGPEEVYDVVADGVLAKGMPAWKPVLGPSRTKDVVAYVLSLRGHEVEGGKAPQGERLSMR